MEFPQTYITTALNLAKCTRNLFTFLQECAVIMFALLTIAWLTQQEIQMYNRLKKLSKKYILIQIVQNLTPVVFVILTVPVSISELYIRTREMDFYMMESVSFELGASVPRGNDSCMFPDQDPFGKEILEYIHEVKPLKCGQIKPYMTYLDTHGKIYINESFLLSKNLDLDDIHCKYSTISLKHHSDDVLVIGVYKTFHNGSQLKAPFVKIKCTDRESGSILYENNHLWVPPLSPQLHSRARASSPDHPSVLMVGLDSMSRLNTIRKLPVSRKFLLEDLGAIELAGLVRTGLNTFPNLLSLLAHMLDRPKYGVDVPLLTPEKIKGFMDDLPFVWKNFSNNGYITMFTEDCPTIPAFKFERQPTDYYTRPFWLDSSGYCMKRCIGNHPAYEYVFNYTRDFVEMMRGRRFFAFSFLTAYTHNNMNSAAYLDKPLRALLDGLRRSGALRDVVVMVYGDHGHRYGAIRVTMQGNMEASMPYLAVALPENLRASHPHLVSAMKGNQRTLISWFDVHELLQDVAAGDLGPQRVRPPRPGSGVQGRSPLRPLPQRSCAEAGVPWDYCVCFWEKPLNLSLVANRHAVHAAAHTLLAHVNALLEGRGSSGASCAPLHVQEVVSSSLVLPRTAMTPRGYFRAVRVTVRVAPSRALLAATVATDVWRPRGHVQGHVERINRYANQSYCERDPLLKTYCFCVDRQGRSPRTDY